jgi:hypothetical protein
LCQNVDLVTLLGQEEAMTDRSNLHDNINLVPFYRQGGRTTLKSRLVDPSYFQAHRVAYLSDRALPELEQATLNDWVEARIADTMP